MTHITKMKKLIFIDACMRAGSRTIYSYKQYDF